MDDLKSQLPEEFARSRVRAKTDLNDFEFAVMGIQNHENSRDEEALPTEALLARYDSLKVLLVDDNQMNRMIASSLLQQKHGIIPDVATTGKEAVNVAVNGDFDLIFMDCMMPEMDGYEATRAIREGAAGEINRDTPIIALTANTHEGDREDCLEAGMNDYLQKPLHVNDLARILRKWCGAGEGFQVVADRGEDLDADMVLDLPTLRTVLNEDEELISDMVGCYRNILLESLSSIEKAIEDGQALEQIRFHTHTIRGSSAQYGARQLRDAAARMEDACNGGSFERAASVFAEVKTLSREVLEGLGNSTAGRSDSGFN